MLKLQNTFIFQEAFVTSEEFGQDLEHVEVLQKKFDEFQKVSLQNLSPVGNGLSAPPFSPINIIYLHFIGFTQP